MAALTVLPARCAGAAAADFLLLHSASSGWASIWSAFSASALGLELDCWPFRDVCACLVWVLQMDPGSGSVRTALVSMCSAVLSRFVVIAVSWNA